MFRVAKIALLRFASTGRQSALALALIHGILIFIFIFIQYIPTRRRRLPSFSSSNFPFCLRPNSSRTRQDVASKLESDRVARSSTIIVPNTFARPSGQRLIYYGTTLLPYEWRRYRHIDGRRVRAYYPAPC